jgi:hypothetical protein
MLLSHFDTVPNEIKGGQVRFRGIMDFEVAYQEAPTSS